MTSASTPSTDRGNAATSHRRRPLRLAFVVQRYGEEINGGAEYHCRIVAEHLAKQHRVEVMTTCATDYITWKNDHPPGSSSVRGVAVHRFKVRRPRDPIRFGRLSQRIFRGARPKKDELEWLDEQGPYAPALLRFLVKHHQRYDYFIFFSYRYYHSYHGVTSLPEKAVLVPTAERDEVVELSIFERVFREPRAIVYNSYEERQMIWEASGNRDVRGDVVGVGSEVPESVDEQLFPRKFPTHRPYALYVGRIDPNKGCRLLFNYFRRYREETPSSLDLVLIGGQKMEIPDEPFFRYAGFVSDAEKWSALKNARLLIMPSELESLSMVTLEAWSVGKPVLANGRCDVLKGQCRRSNAGLYFEDYYEFREALSLLEADESFRDALGANGRRFYERHYRWPVIEEKYNRILFDLEGENERGRTARPAPVTPFRGNFLARWLRSA